MSLELANGTAIHEEQQQEQHDNYRAIQEQQDGNRESSHSRPTSFLKRKSKLHWLMLSLCSLITVVSTVAVFLLARYYFTQGGTKRWLSAWIQVAGWPLSAAILVSRRSSKRYTDMIFVSRDLALAYLALGIINAGVCFLYAWGISYLPASTSSMIISTQLVFNSIFSMVIVRKPMSPYIWNALVLMTCSTVLVGLHSDSDKPAGLTHLQYVLGFVMTLGAALLFGLMLTLFEVITKNLLAGSKTAVPELMTSINFIATVILSIGMAINGDFGKMPGESRVFKSGPVSYYMTLVWSAIVYQVQYLAVSAVAMLASSLLSGVLITASTPLVSILAFFFFHDDLGGIKIMALVISVWAFVSYAYGGYLDEKSKAKNTNTPGEERTTVVKRLP